MVFKIFDYNYGRIADAKEVDVKTIKGLQKLLIKMGVTEVAWIDFRQGVIYTTKFGGFHQR
jgi:hypothetical protein